MAVDLTLILDDRPGELARMGEVLGDAGVNIAGLAAFTGEGRGVIHVLVDDDATARATKALKAVQFDASSTDRAPVACIPMPFAYMTPPIVMVRPSPAPASPFEASRSIGPQPFDSLSQVRSETKTSPVGAAACAGTADTEMKNRSGAISVMSAQIW